MKLDALLNPTTSSASAHPSPPSALRPHAPYAHAQPHHDRAGSASFFAHIDNNTRLPLPRNNSTSSHGSSPSRSPTSTSVPPLDRSNSSDSARSTSPVSTPEQHLDYAHQRFPAQPLVHHPKHHITLPPVRPHIEHLRSSSASHFGRPYPPMAQNPADAFAGAPAPPTPDFGFPSAPPAAHSRALSQPQANYTAPPPYLMHQHAHSAQLSPAMYPPPPAGPVNTASKSTRKNSYPCPVAKQYSCNEFFTTSGHAARHAKKHTGKKDAICPECGKAFTRKDNMEQHRRTHSGNRSSAGSSAAAAKRETPDEAAARRAKQQQRKTRPSSISTASPVPSNADLALLDPQLRGSPLAGLFPVSEADVMAAFGGQQQPLPTGLMRPDLQQTASAVQASLGGLAQYPSPPASSPSIAPALDALALAASRQNDEQ